jgi:hypothetical protein
VYQFKSKAGEAIGDFVVSCKSHSGHQMEGCRRVSSRVSKYIVVVVCGNRCGNLYLSKGITKESEVADTRGSTATPCKPLIGHSTVSTMAYTTWIIDHMLQFDHFS